MGIDTTDVAPTTAGDLLADAIIEILRQTGTPNGLHAFGFGPDDVYKLVEGTLPQHRVTKLSPRPADSADLQHLFMVSMTLW